METIGSKRSYALTRCMPKNDDDDDRPWAGLARKRRASGQRQRHAILSLCKPENKQENENKYSQGMDTGIGGKYTFSDGTPAHICIHFIFIANKRSGPVMISVYLR